ncbi:S8 family serine peptidase [Clostridioides difficile]|uniref:S8 family serine peptidase n=2 Tax=Clostridioides difficile TaxID=1496 RepID=UPI00098011B7|nr:S8 family serine peptidase [Clostridioides difficile]MCI9996471.1 S8 family serine peptidase [Clostridioides difficile]SJP02231.1 Major intracellular serine protease precursor [Clostridioides difficile]HBF5455613.1 S8 family serine peptidase [Clostridioides difficile]HBF5457874.1 S8 family serine peptidase [Clostridioides difficile]
MEKKIKIAVIDTGVDINHEYLKDVIGGGISFEYDEKYIFTSDNYCDYNGHGTACVSTIKNEFRNLEFFIVKIMDEYGKTNIQILEEALKYLLNTDISIINLSLSVMNSNEVDDLYKICEELNKKGKIIVSSVANGYEETYPAIFDNVIGVKGFILEDENTYWFNKNEKVQCIADDNPYLRCHINNSYKLFGKCNSQAAAKVTGIIANILSENPNIKFEELNEKLEICATRNFWTKEDLLKSKRFPIYKKNMYKMDKYIFEKTYNIVKDFINKEIFYYERYDFRLFNQYNGIEYDECFRIIEKLESEFNLKFNYMNISRYDFVSINTLADLVKRKLDVKQKD